MGVRVPVQRPLMRVRRELGHYLRDRSTIKTKLIGYSVKNILEKPKRLRRGRKAKPKIIIAIKIFAFMSHVRMA